MHKSIAEAEDQIEKKVAQQIERRIQAVHQILDALKLRVLTCLAPTNYLMTLQEDVVVLRADVDSILDIRVPKPKAAPLDLPEDLDHHNTTASATCE